MVPLRDLPALMEALLPLRSARQGARVAIARVSPARDRAHALVRQPEAGRRRARLPEDVDRDAAARIPIAADAQPARRHRRHEILGDAKRAILVESAVIAIAAEIELQRLRFDQPFHRRIIDDDMREIRLAGHRAQRGEFRRGEADEIGLARMRIGDEVELGLVGRSGQRRFLPEKSGALVRLRHAQSS